MINGPFVPHINLWEPCYIAKVPDGLPSLYSQCPLDPRKRSPFTHVWVRPCACRKSYLIFLIFGSLILVANPEPRIRICHWNTYIAFQERNEALSAFDGYCWQWPWASNNKNWLVSVNSGLSVPEVTHYSPRAIIRKTAIIFTFYITDFFHKTFLFCQSKPNVNIIRQNAVIWVCYFVTYEQWSTVSSASSRTPHTSYPISVIEAVSLTSLPTIQRTKSLKLL